jgi:hypothetical protein
VELAAGLRPRVIFKFVVARRDGFPGNIWRRVWTARQLRASRRPVRRFQAVSSGSCLRVTVRVFVWLL